MELAAPLDVELRLFEQRRKQWAIEHTGKFVVIQDETVLAEFFEEYATAFKAGIKAFGISRSFLVKQIWTHEPVYFVA